MIHLKVPGKGTDGVDIFFGNDTMKAIEVKI